MSHSGTNPQSPGRKSGPSGDRLCPTDESRPFWPSANGVAKLNLNTKEAMFAFGSSRLFKRLRCHGWLKPLEPSRDALYPRSRIEAVQKRMEDGELPPELPSDIAARAKRLAERKLT